MNRDILQHAAFDGGAGFVFFTLVVFLVFCAVGYGIYHFIRRKKSAKNRKVFFKKRRRSFYFGLRRTEILIIVFLGSVLIWGARSEHQIKSALQSISTHHTHAEGADAEHGDGKIYCQSPYIIDGDTLTCAKVRVRLYGIDAPEMPGHCKAGRRCTRGNPHASKEHLETLTRGNVVCTRIEIDHYGRTIARCTAGGEDISCAMVKAKHAVRRYGNLTCP